MNKIIAISIFVAALASPALADDWDAPNADADGSAMLSEELSAIAHQTLGAARNSPATWGQTAALYRAAIRLNPNEPRFFRALIENLLAMQDIPGAIDALSGYYQLNRDDQVAQVQRIDLELSQMQSADKKIEYLRQILPKQPVNAAVRSFAAFRLAQLYLEKSQPQDALKALGTAITLNRLNVDALLMKYEMTQGTALPLDRVNQLLAILYASPSDPAVPTLIAQQLADLGLVQQSLLWYSNAQNLSVGTGLRPDPQFFRGVSTELFLADHIPDALNVLTKYLTVIPGDSDAWFIDLAILKYQASQNKDDQTAGAANEAAIRQASNSLYNQLAMQRKAAGDAQATTRPMNDPPGPLPDLFGDVARLSKASGGTDLAQAYVSTLATLAWVDLYFRHDAAAADPILKVLGQLLDDRDVQLVRLVGWQEYVAGDSAGAATKLSAIADRDPLAALGMILIDLANPAKHDEAIGRAKVLLSLHPSGALGAMLWGEFKPLGISIEPSAQAGPVSTAIAGFPQGILSIIGQPQNFYIVRAEPVASTLEFGQPALVRVILVNMGAMDLYLGNRGIIHSDLWFDAIPLNHSPISGAAFDLLGQRLVLPEAQNVSVIVRVDQDALYPLFHENPQATEIVDINVVTNPVEMASGQPNQPPQAIAGPAGLRVRLSQTFQRRAVPIDTPGARTKLLDRLDKGDGGQKIRTLQVLRADLALARGANPPADAKAAVDVFSAALRKSTTDGSANVRAYAKYAGVLTSAPADRRAAIELMEHDADWQTRLLALAAAPILGNDAQGIAAQMAADPDPVVAAYAKSMASPPATAAATQPSPAAPNRP